MRYGLLLLCLCLSGCTLHRRPKPAGADFNKVYSTSWHGVSIYGDRLIYRHP